MCTKIFVFFALFSIVQVMAAPQPINWSQLGRNALDLGRKAVPVVKNGCQLLTGQQPVPQIYYVNVPYQQIPQRGYRVQYQPAIPNNNVAEVEDIQ